MKETNTTIFDTKFKERTVRHLKTNKREIIHLIESFIQENNEALFTPYPIQGIKYSNRTLQKFFDVCGVTDEEIGNAIKETKLTDASWKNINKPIYVCLFLAIKRFTEIGARKEAEACSMMMAILIYGTRHITFFPHTTSEGFQNAIKYTVNNLSNKYYLKQRGSVYGAIEATLETLNETNMKYIKSNKDIDCMKFIRDMITRMHQFVKNLAKLVHENYKNKKYLSTERDQDNEEGNLLDSDNASIIIEKITERVYTSVKTNEIDPKTSTLVAKTNSITPISLSITLKTIAKNETENIENLIRLILTVFIIDNLQSNEYICSAKFILTCLQSYNKSNTKEKHIIELKDSLDKILSRNSKDYNNTSRQATKTNFRKAVFQYFATYIQIVICK